MKVYNVEILKEEPYNDNYVVIAENKDEAREFVTKTKYEGELASNDCKISLLRRNTEKGGVLWLDFLN